MTLPRRLLIANRGEIACRIARTARRLGIRTIAVYSDADDGALHVRTADQAVRIGPASAAESYLRIDAILDAARRSGADAIHPGYGFLSENAGFAQACADAGLVFVGPPPDAIRAMGSKSAAKALMAAAGVPLTPGYHGIEQDPTLLREEAIRLGFPVLIKASAGGGGKGMRRVDRAEDFAAALDSCRREAAAAFGDDRVLLERYVLQPRHIEIQVFADTHGNVVHLFERDCSVQRRHQKVLEEAPAPGMTTARRAAMGQAAVEATRAVGYVGAGTVEFIVAPDGSFFFMEMNTRLQVEHPVTEMITGLDLVEWQLRVAAGEPLPRTQEELAINGHAIEARLYAEDPARGFLPSTGRLVHLAFPEAAPNLRVDAGVAEGDAISPFYDAMIAKLIVHGATRDVALRRMQQALAACRIAGVTSNLDFLGRLVATPAFVSADLDTALIEREQAMLFAPEPPVTRAAWLAVAAAVLAREAGTAAAATSPWDDRSGWRFVGSARRRLVLRSRGEEAAVDITYLPSGSLPRSHELQGDSTAVWRLECDGLASEASARWLDHVHLSLCIDGVRECIVMVSRDGGFWRLDAGRSDAFELVDPFARRNTATHAESHLRAPMPGRVVSLLATPGACVVRGAPLLVLEAMKMEHTLVAPADGLLVAYRVELGEQVAEGAELVEFQPAAD